MVPQALEKRPKITGTGPYRSLVSAWPIKERQEDKANL